MDYDLTSAAFQDEIQKLALVSSGGTPSSRAAQRSVQRKKSPWGTVARYGLSAAALGGAGYLSYRALPGAVKGLQEGAHTLGRFLKNPREGKAIMQEGWGAMSNVTPHTATEAGEALGRIRGASLKEEIQTARAAGKTNQAARLGQKLQKTLEKAPKKEQKFWGRWGHRVQRDAQGNITGGAPTIEGAAPWTWAPKAWRGEGYGGATGIRGVAEEASRRGWTGAGKATKYAPVGMKTIGIGFPAHMVASGELSKKDPHNTGQGQAERAGRMVGENVGYVAGWPIGAVGGAMAGRKAVQQAQAKATGRLGRYFARGAKGGIVPMIAGTALVGGAGALAGRFAGRQVDKLTGQHQEAQARKGLQDYMKYRRKQMLEQQREAAQSTRKAY